jgi:hypothetical protein
MSDRKSYCRSCGKPVLWVETENGRRMPLDYEPEQRFVLDAHTDPMTARMRRTYASHFSTCPNAAQHRKERTDG